MLASRRVLLALVLLVGMTLAPRAVFAAPLCFDVPEITNCIDGRFRSYWEEQGGLAVFGYPIGPAADVQTAEGMFLAQDFERNRFELHPGLAAPYDVLLGRLGDVRLQQQGRDWFTFPKAAPNIAHYFAATGHAIAHEPFWQFWSGHGLEFDGTPGFSEAESLALFGLPLSEPSLEITTTGEQVLTQWFERARFEDHGSQGVLLGLLGNETRAAPAQPAPTPPSTPPAPTCARPPASLYGTLSPACVFGGEMLTGEGTGFKPGEIVGFYVTGPDNTVFDFPVYQGDAAADDYGVYHLRGALGRLSSPGVYALTLKGDESKHVSVLYFSVKPLDLTSEPPFDFSVIPPGQNARAIPESGKRGTRFRFEAGGFDNELVGVYATMPDGQVLGAPFLVPTSGGGVDDSLRLTSSPSDPVGIVVITFEGLESGKKAICYLRYLP